MDAPAAGDGAGVPNPESSYNRSATLGITGADNTPLRAAAGQGSPFAGAPFMAQSRRPTSNKIRFSTSTHPRLSVWQGRKYSGP
eukprot:COSAG04_NODE_1702_length_5888_cov_2.061323_2_plen_84_part_00